MTRIPFAVGLTEIHRIARRQVYLLGEGRWDEAISLLKMRRELMGRMRRPDVETVRPLLPLCDRILAADERIYSSLAAVRNTLAHRLRSLQNAEDTPSTYRPTGIYFMRVSRYLDLLK
ncbi:MAG: hypothetical protein R6U92_06575 [Bacillota bacterium]